MILKVIPLKGRLIKVLFSGGESRVIKAPISPHFYTPEYPEGYANKKVIKRLLSTLEPTELFQVFAEEERYVYQMRREMTSYEANQPYKQVLNNMFGFKQKDMDITHAAWDIEVISEGQFPKAKKDPLTAISYYDKIKQHTFLSGSEKNIIQDFVSCVKEHDPDILDTYYGAKFDYGYAIKRAKINGIRLEIGRKNDVPVVKRREYTSGKRTGVTYTINMEGRLSFDVWKEVNLDTSLTGKIKNKKLKTIARHFFDPKLVIEVDRTKIGDLTQKELYWYCLSDSRLTWKLAEHYLTSIKFLAYLHSVPLSFIIDRSPSHLGNLIYGRGFNQEDIVSDGFNKERFKGILWP